MAKQFKPAHRVLATFRRGKVRFSCVCGWQSKRWPGEQYQEAFATYMTHAGLREKATIGVKGGDG